MEISAARERLAGDLPPVLLLVGPGARSLARETWEHHGMSGMEITALSVELAQKVVWDSNLLPGPGREHRDYLIFTDSSSPGAQDVLLKVLEEPPPWCRFILAGSRRPAVTVESRCYVIAVAGGQDRTRAADAETSRVRGKVGAAITAARSGDPDRLSLSVRGWAPEHTAQLGAWAAEAASGRWDSFSEGFAPGATPGRALRVLELLRLYAGARLGAVVALEKAFAPG